MHPDRVALVGGSPDAARAGVRCPRGLPLADAGARGLEPRRGDARGEANVLASCASDAAQVSFAENDALKNRLDAANERLSGAKERLPDVAADRDALRKRSELERDRMYASHQKLAEALAEAAKKSSAPAVATATASSDGRARMDAKERRESAAPQTAPVALVNAPWMAAAAQPAAGPASARVAEVGRRREGAGVRPARRGCARRRAGGGTAVVDGYRRRRACPRTGGEGRGGEAGDRAGAGGGERVSSEGKLEP